MQTKYPLIWEHGDPATPALADPLMDDIGIAGEGKPEQLRARAAAKEHALRIIRQYVEEQEILTMGELDTIIDNYYQGYLSCLLAHNIKVK